MVKSYNHNESADGTNGSGGGGHSWLHIEAALHPTICSEACHHLGKGAISLQLQEFNQYFCPINILWPNQDGTAMGAGAGHRMAADGALLIYNVGPEAQGR